MGKGISPLRIFMRSNSKRSLAESSEGNSSEASVSTTPQRQPLCPIPEALRNPVTPTLEQSEATTPKSISKVGQTTPRAKAKLNFSTQEKFPHLENSDSNVSRNLQSITPEKSATGSSASTGAQVVANRSKYTWQTHGTITSAGGSSSRTSPAQGRFRVPQENSASDGNGDMCTPPRPTKQLSGDAGTGSTIQQSGLPNSARASSLQTTPKSSKGSRSGYDSESGIQSQNNTPARNVSRSLKYSQQQPGSNNAGAAGLASVRSTGSHHVLSRTMGVLQGVKGPSNAQFVEQQFDLVEDPSFWTDHNVQVLIRTRPFNSSELAAQGTSRCLRQESPHTLTWLGSPEARFTFDHVAGDNITQENLFRVAGLPMVENCMAGYNSCMFAYGQTGSGKTHTMLGDIEELDHRPSEQRGMTPRVFEHLFSKIEKDQDCRRAEQLKYSCKCSFLEIYNEQITDLLEPASANLQLREDAKKGVYVENLTEVEVQGVQDVIQLLLQGSANRKVASTNMNRESSRSHSVFTCIVESKWEANSMTNFRYGRLHLVDLAGSERQKTSGAEGGRLKEAANINKSLSTLGLVIMILVDVANGKQRHVPYRDSKLTFLLQDSLGGNSKTIMIANVSPSSCSAMETLGTLKFAQRAKFIQNNAVINEDASGDVMVLRQQIQVLKVEVDRLRRESMSQAASMRFGSSLQLGSMDGDASVEKNDSEAVDSGHSPDSAHVKTRAYILEKKLKGMEAVLAGALRREQVAEETTRKMAAETEHLNRLVKQREEDSQCSKMMLRFRDEKIRSLEGVADGAISAETHLREDQKALTEEVKVLRARIDRNPELTRFAMENLRLMEQLRRYQEFYECGEKAALLDEISGLRNQLLDVLDAKLGDEPGKLTTPQKRDLAPEIAARARENDLLLLQVQEYQTEVKECRANLNNCLEANSELTRQVDQMQAMINQLKIDSSSKQLEFDLLKSSGDEERTLARTNQEDSLKVIEDLRAELRTNEARWDAEAAASAALQQQLQSAVDEVSHLRKELEEYRQWSETVQSSPSVVDRLQSTEASLAAAQATASTAQATVKQVRQETEELALQQRESLSSIQEAASSWRLQELELRSELANAEKIIEQLNAEIGHSGRSGELVSKSSGHETLQKQHELEMRHCEEISQLQLVLEEVEKELTDERRQRIEASERAAALAKLLEDATSKLHHEKRIVEAFEGQNLFAIHELENAHAELAKVSDELKESEKRTEALELELEEMEDMQCSSEKQLDDMAHKFEQKLIRAKRDREEVRTAYEKFKLKRASSAQQEREMEVIRTQAETETALALTTMQEEILELRGKVAAFAEAKVVANLQVVQMKRDVEDLVNQEKAQLQVSYDALVAEKDAELQNVQRFWESATTELINYLAEGDQELREVAREMDDLVESSFSPRLVGAWRELSDLDHENLVRSKKQKALEILCRHLQEAQTLAKETEVSVRALRDKCPIQKEGRQQVISEDVERMVIGAFVLVGHLSDRVQQLDASHLRLSDEKKDLLGVNESKDALISDLLKKLECESMRKHSELVKVRQELEDALLESGTVKVEVLDLQQKLGWSHDRMKALEGLVLQSEVQLDDVEAKVLQFAQKCSKAEQQVHCQLLALEEVLSRLDELLGDPSAVDFEAFAVDLATNIRRDGVFRINEELGKVMESHRVEVTTVLSELSKANRKLELKEEERCFLRQGQENSSVALRQQIALLAIEKETSDGLGEEKDHLVASLRSEVKQFEVKLAEAESRIVEMETGVEALSIAKQKTEIERDSFKTACHAAENMCLEKEQAILQIQSDLSLLQSRVSEAECREKSISKRMEEMTMAKNEREVESDLAAKELETIKAEMRSFALSMNGLCEEVEQKERVIISAVRNGEAALEAAEEIVRGLDSEIKREMENLEDKALDVEEVASVKVKELEVKKHQLVKIEQAVEALKAEQQFRIDQWEGVKVNLESEREKLKEAYISREVYVQNQLTSVEQELNVSRSECACLKTAVAQLDFGKAELELRIAQMVGDLQVAKTNLQLREKELDDLRIDYEELQVRYDDAESSVKRIENLIHEHILSEESWKAEEGRLLEKLKEVEALTASCDLENKENGAEYMALSNSMDIPYEHISRLKHQVVSLKRSNLEKDRTILSARKELETALTSLNEAELEMDKLQAEKDILIESCEESANSIINVSTNLRIAEEELLSKQLQIERHAAEIERVSENAKESELRMSVVDQLWKAEKEELVKQLDAANLDAREKGHEAIVLNKKLQDAQVTLMEAEGLVNLLVRANEGWKAERDVLRQSQEVWLPERDRLVLALNCLDKEMNEREQQTMNILKETAAEISLAISFVDSTMQQISLLRSEEEKEMERLTFTMGDLKDNVYRLHSVSKGLGMDASTVCTLLSNQEFELSKDQAQIKSLESNVQALEACAEKHLMELRSLEEKLAVLERRDGQIVEPMKPKMSEDDHMDLAATADSTERVLMYESQVNALYKQEEVEELEFRLETAQEEIQRLNKTVGRLTNATDAAQEKIIVGLSLTIQTLSTRNDTAEVSLRRRAHVNLQDAENKLNKAVELEQQLIVAASKTAACEAQILRLTESNDKLRSHVQQADSQFENQMRAWNTEMVEILIEREALFDYTGVLSEALSAAAPVGSQVVEEECNGSLSSNNDNVTVLRHQLEVAETDNSTLSQIVSSLQLEITEAEDRIIQLETQLQESCKEKSKLSAEILKNEDVLSKLVKELDNLQVETGRLEAEKRSLDSEVVAIFSALDSSAVQEAPDISSLGARIRQLKSDLKSERTSSGELREALTRAHEDNLELVEQLEAQLLAQASALISAEEDLSVLKSELTKETDLYSGELKRANEENVKLRGMLEARGQELREEKDQFQVKAQKVKAELEEGMLTVNDLEEKLAASELENARLLQTLQDKCLRLTKERDTLIEERAASADWELHTVCDTSGGASDTHDEALLVEGNLKIAGIAIEDGFEVQELSKPDVEELKERFKDLVKENDELKCEVITFECRIADLEDMVERKSRSLSDLDCNLGRLMERFKEDDSKQAQKVLQVMADVRSVEENINLLVTENDGLNVRFSEVEDSVLELEKEMEGRKVIQLRLEEKLSVEEENSFRLQADLKNKVQDLQMKVAMLESELSQQLDIQKQLTNEVRIATSARQAIIAENGHLQKCVLDMEQSHALCMNEVFTQALMGMEGFQAAHIELDVLGEALDEVHLHSQSVLSGNLETTQNDLSNATIAIHELRGHVKGLLDLTSTTENVLSSKLAGFDSLQNEMLLRKKLVLALEGDRLKYEEESRTERRWLLKSLQRILSKVDETSSDLTTRIRPDEQRLGDRDFVFHAVQEYMASIEQALDAVLCHRDFLKTEVGSLQIAVSNVEVQVVEKSEKGHRMEHELRLKNQDITRLIDEQVFQEAHNARLIGVYKLEIETLQSSLVSTIEDLRHFLREPSSLSLLEEEQRQLVHAVTRVDFGDQVEDLKTDMYTLQHAIAELHLRSSALEEELDDKRDHLHHFMADRERFYSSIQELTCNVKRLESERDKFQTEVLVVNEQLEMAQSQAEEHELAAIEARQIAEQSKGEAEKKHEEIKILEKSVEELESTVYALESQLGIVKREAEKQRRTKEDLEGEQSAMKQQMHLMKITIDRQDAQSVRGMEDAKTAKTELDRMVIEMKSQQMQTRKTVESLQQECAEKDLQLRSCKAHIADLMTNAEKQATENQQKLKALENMVEQLKMEDRKVTSGAATASKSSESKHAVNRPKGSGSPFKCIGSGLSQQRSSEIDEELSGARKRIKELEALAATRQKEVFMLNTKLAEAESMTHDVVRDLLGVKMDIASYASLLSQQKVQQIADKARRRTEEAHQKNEEIERLRGQLDELIAERLGWLEEINRRQAEAVAARVSAEKLRLRDSLLANDNDKLKTENATLRKKVSDLEEEYRKLSGQQNLQQRIHHHAKIKEENNALRTENEDLGGKLRRTEILFSRVNDELARYRSADGKAPFLNFDEEERLRKKLQEAEDNRMQLAQNFVSLCTAIVTAAGFPRTSRDPDAPTALKALLQLQDRLEAMERELQDVKLKVRIATEKRRMSDLREQHTPRKSGPTNFTAGQQITSPDSSSR